jgi:hypothetical protein
MDIILTRINSQWYDINNGRFIVRKMQQNWVVVEQSTEEPFSIIISRGASMDAALDNWLFREYLCSSCQLDDMDDDYA